MKQDNQTVRRTSRWAATLAVLAAVALGLSACGTNPNSNSKVTITDSASSNNYAKICKELFPLHTVVKDAIPKKPGSSVVVTAGEGSFPNEFTCTYSYKRDNSMTKYFYINIFDHNLNSAPHTITVSKGAESNRVTATTQFTGASIQAYYAQPSMVNNTPSSKLRPLLQHALGRLRFAHGS